MSGCNDDWVLHPLELHLDTDLWNWIIRGESICIVARWNDYFFKVTSVLPTTILAEGN